MRVIAYTHASDTPTSHTVACTHVMSDEVGHVCMWYVAVCTLDIIEMGRLPTKGTCSIETQFAIADSIVPICTI